MKIKKIPLRLCLACQEMKPKKDLLRIIKNKDGVISVDTTGKMAGRGAYVCKNESCHEKTKKAKKLERAFGVNVSEEIYDNIRNQVAQNSEE